MLNLLRRVYLATTGRSPRSAENIKGIANLVKKGTEVTWLASFPRSGNTWLRLVITEYLLRLSGVNEFNVFEEVKTTIPDFTRDPILLANKNIAHQPKLVKTHDTYFKTRSLVPRSARSAFRYLYLFRAPEDALTSFFHYSNRAESGIRTESPSPDRFAIENARPWAKTPGELSES